MLGNQTTNHTAASGSVIFLENVTKKYDAADQVPALSGISLSIEAGEFVFVTGSSGSGKTTLIRLLTRELSADKGTVRVLDQDLTRIRRGRISRLRRRLGIVFQDFRLLRDRTIYDNVALAMRAVGAPAATVRPRVEEVLNQVGLLDRKTARPGQLSGGEQQKAALARALVNHPEIILADEPTGNLDADSAWEIMDLLEAANQAGTTVVVVTHNREIVEKMAKRVITMKRGMIIRDEKLPSLKER